MEQQKLLEFGIYLKKLRENKKLTLSELANITNYSDAYISQVEKARRKNPPTIEMLKALSSALDVPFSELLNKAGYEELSEGQYYKEVLSELDLLEQPGDQSDMSDKSNEFKKVTELMELYYRGVVRWSNDKLLNEVETVLIREHFYNLLLGYKQLIESYIGAKSSWPSLKDSYETIHGQKFEQEENKDEWLRGIFLHQELEKKIKQLMARIESFPSWMIDTPGSPSEHGAALRLKKK